MTGAGQPHGRSEIPAGNPWDVLARWEPPTTPECPRGHPADQECPECTDDGPVLMAPVTGFDLFLMGQFAGAPKAHPEKGQ